MRRILLSLVVMGAVFASVAAGTQAVFTDSDTFVGNTLSTATVSIDAISEPFGLLPKPLIVSGLVPGGWSDYARGVVYNQAGSTPVRLYMYVENLVGAACDKVHLQVWTGHANSGAASERSITLVDNWLTSVVGAGARVEITGPGKIFDPTIPVNTSAVIQQRAGLHATAGDSYQGTTCTWDEVFVAETP